MSSKIMQVNRRWLATEEKRAPKRKVFFEINDSLKPRRKKRKKKKTRIITNTNTISPQQPTSSSSIRTLDSTITTNLVTFDSDNYRKLVLEDIIGKLHPEKDRFLTASLVPSELFECLCKTRQRKKITKIHKMHTRKFDFPGVRACFKGLKLNNLFEDIKAKWNELTMKTALSDNYKYVITELAMNYFKDSGVLRITVKYDKELMKPV